MDMKIERAREGNPDPWIVLKEAYPQARLSDALRWDIKKEIDVGFAGLARPEPILSRLLKKEIFVNFLLKNGTEKSTFLFSEGVSYQNGKPILLPPPAKKALAEVCQSLSDYGGTLNPDGSHTINLLSPEIGPHYGVNLLLGWREGYPEPLLTTPKSVVDSFGRGSFRSQAAYQVLATRWDVRPEENGNPFNRQFYLVEDGEEIFYSADVSRNVKEAFCTHYPNKTRIVYVMDDGLKIERTIFLLAQKEGCPEATEVQLVTLTSPKTRRLQIVFTGVFGFSAPQCQEVDVIYQTVIHQSEVLRNEKGEVVALSPNYYPVYFNKSPRFVSFLSHQGFADSFSNDATAFLGHGTIASPEGVFHLDNTLKVKGASFFALGKMLEVPAKETVSCATLTGMVEDEKGTSEEAEKKLQNSLGHLLDVFPTPEALGKQLEEQEHFLHDYSAYFQIHSGSVNTDAMVNDNLPFQTMYQSFVSRAFAQTQKGYREIGFREVQDLYASIPYLVHSGHQELAKALLGKWITNVYRIGYANHNFYSVGKEPGMCSDDQLWLLPALSTYVETTGDYDFLRQEFPTADDGVRSVLLTIEAILAYSTKISIGKHGLPLLDKADWNDCLKIDVDCLDGPSKEKLYRAQLERNHQEYGAPFESELSESVMNAFLAIVALDKGIELMELAGEETLKAEFIDMKNTMAEAIQKSAFINGYFARVLINRENPLNGIRYVGAPGDGLSSVKSLQNGSIYLNSLSWSLLSGVATEEQIASMLALADTYLKTPSGYKLCSEEDLTLTGAKEAATSHYFPGDRENGGVFKHATMMFSRALLSASKRPYSTELRQKMVDDAYFMMHLVYPYHCLSNPYFFKGNPRFCTQYNNPITQENIGPILSGTATWLTLSLWEAMGFEFSAKGLSFYPMLEKDQGVMDYQIRQAKATYDVHLDKRAGQYSWGVESLKVDGVDHDPKEPIPLFEDGKTHSILLTLK
jgi:cellobiose phosphorylase